MRVFHNSFFPVGETSWSRCNLPGELAGETRSDALRASEGHRATIKKRLLHRSARACPSPAFSRKCNPTIAGDRPPRYDKKTPPLTVGRGPVPRHRPRTPTLAGDRPPRYGEIETRRSLLLLLDEVGGTSLSRCTGRRVSPTEEHKKRQRILKIRCPRKRNSRKLTLYLL